MILSQSLEQLMSLSIHVDRQNSFALYKQIIEQIKNQIGDGRLPPGTRLPTVRHLAEELGVTRLTIQNAYSELQTTGWLEATVGRGTFVSQSARPSRLATTIMSSSGESLTPDAVITNMMLIHQLESDPATGIRSMAVAAPDSRFFPAEEFWASLISLQSDAQLLVAYGSPQGDPVLRVEMSELLQRRGLNATPDEIIITSGATHGLALVAQALASPGDTVLVEQPTYMGFLHVLKAQKLQPIGVPLEAEGPQLDLLERAVVQHRPRFFYTAPSFQNPTGLCTSIERRHKLIELAEKYGFILVEDDIYGRLAYDAPPPTPMKALDCSGSVVYLSSESKVLMPGIRVGTVVAPRPLHDRLLSLRRATDLCGPPLLQRALAGFLQAKGMQRHLRRVLPIYRKRRDTLMRALRRNMPEQVTWTEPQGGFCCWLTLPNLTTLHDIHRAALQIGLVLAPGDVFLTEPGTQIHLRLSFGNQSEEAIRSGVELLAGLIRERLEMDERAEQLVDWMPLV